MIGPAMRHLDGFAALAEAYDGFIVDLWGVVHDGISPYPGALDCLQRLRRAGRRVVLLSNAPRRVAAVRAGLRAMGIAEALYDGIVSSGEATREALRQRYDPWFAGLGRRLLHLGPPKDAELFEGLGLDQVDDPETADFLLNTGPDDEEAEAGTEPYLPLLRACAARRLPMLCANPDLEIVRGGRRIPCAGMLARFYQQFGGTVHSIGKPHPEVYRIVRSMLELPAARILAVGDALATDIAGAAAAGLPSCWVLGGIHAEAIGDDPALARAEAAAAGLAPLAAIPAFRW